MTVATVEILGEVKGYECLHEIMRLRAEALAMTRESIDELAGLQPGYAAKVLAPRPIKRMGSLSMGLMLPALGMKLVAIVDEEALERLRRFGPKRHAGAASHAGTVRYQISRRELRKRQRKGGHNSRKYLPKSKVRALARKAGLAGNKKRWSKPTLVEIKR
jgi:hypothetical protein